MDQQAFELLKSMLIDMKSGLDNVREELIKQNEISLRNTISLEDHMKRTNLLENYVQTVEKQLQLVQNQLAHVDTHVEKVEKVIGFFSLTPKKLWILLSLAGALLAFLIQYRETIIKLLDNLYN